MSEDGSLARLQVEPDGSTTQVGFTPRPRRLWARPTMILGVVLCIGTAVLLDSERAKRRRLLHKIRTWIEDEDGG